MDGTVDWTVNGASKKYFGADFGRGRCQNPPGCRPLLTAPFTVPRRQFTVPARHSRQLLTFSRRNRAKISNTDGFGIARLQVLKFHLWSPFGGQSSRFFSKKIALDNF